MPFQTDTLLATRVGRLFGEYVNTLVSDHGQARADLFRRGNLLEAHVSFPTGLDAGSTTDDYVGDLLEFAKREGFEGRLRMIFS